MTRRFYSGSDIARAQTIMELRHLARLRLPDFVWQYIESGAEDEHTLTMNRQVFREYAFSPRTLVDTTHCDTSAMLFGKKMPTPLIIGPTGFNGLAYPKGDLALARAAHSHGMPFTLSTFSNVALEEIASSTDGDLWLQLYLLDDWRITEALIGRAKRSGVSALVVTTDANIASGREWQKRCYRAPGKLALRHQIDTLRNPRWLTRFAMSCMQDGLPRFENLRPFFSSKDINAIAGARTILDRLKPNITWEGIKRIRALWDGPLIVKGVLSLDDARKAREVGADSIVLSNHGGRQLDDALPPLNLISVVKDALPAMPLLVDSGFRRGNDILKAIGLGATGILLGRATLYGLASAGQAGVERALQILVGELHRSLGLLGCIDLASVHERLVRFTPSVSHSQHLDRIL